MFVPVSHSIPQGAGIVFDTPEGYIIHSGDFKLDPTPVDARPTDLPQFAYFGWEGVGSSCPTAPMPRSQALCLRKHRLAGEIQEIIGRAQGRVVSACFASHIHRVQQMIDAGLANGRKIAFLGRSMHRVTGVGADLGVLECRSPRSSTLSIS